MTIREAIAEYTNAKIKYWTDGKEDFITMVKTTTLCIRIPLNNGIEIFINIEPKSAYLQKYYPQLLPNKKGIYRRLRFDICNAGKPIRLTDNIKKCASESTYNDADYEIINAKERDVNEFINANGGINVAAYKKTFGSVVRVISEKSLNQKNIVRKKKKAASIFCGLFLFYLKSI